MLGGETLVLAVEVCSVGVDLDQGFCVQVYHVGTRGSGERGWHISDSQEKSLCVRSSLGASPKR